MKINNTPIDGLKTIDPKIFGDERGFFFESYNKQKLEKNLDRPLEFIQDNHSRSCQGVLRGLHFQRGMHAQCKLVRVVMGEIFDVAVDIRIGSPTFGCWHGEFLSAENKRQFLIPEGFAHGFLTLSNIADVLYKTTANWYPASEGCLRWDDPTLAIAWPKHGALILSEKDKKGLNFSELTSFLQTPFE